RALRGQPAYGGPLVSAEGRQCRADCVYRTGPHRRGLPKRQAQDLEAGAMVEQQPPAESLVDRRRILEYDAQVVGELGVVKQETRAPIGLLEPQQRHPALPGVAVGEVGEEEVASSSVVE